MKILVNNAGEIFGDKVSIADLAQHSFKDCAGLSPMRSREIVRADWQFELQSCRMNDLGIEATFKDGSKLSVAGTDYAKLESVPAWEQFVSGQEAQDPLALKWSGEQAPPAIGAKIRVTMNSIGPAVVSGYFKQDGFLGVLCQLEAPPAWHAKQNNGSKLGHVFGAEFKILEECN